jgi:hypothetical protein
MRTTASILRMCDKAVISFQKDKSQCGMPLVLFCIRIFSFGSKSTTELNESESDPHQAESLEVDSRRAIDGRGEEGGGGERGWLGWDWGQGEYSSTISEGATKL